MFGGHQRQPAHLERKRFPSATAGDSKDEVAIQQSLWVLLRNRPLHSILEPQRYSSGIIGEHMHHMPTRDMKGEDNKHVSSLMGK